METIEKEIDALGRIVLPINLRKKLGLRCYDKVLISLNKNELIITPKMQRCALCGEKIQEITKIKLCRACISKVKSYKP